MDMCVEWVGIFVFVNSFVRVGILSTIYSGCGTSSSEWRNPLVEVYHTYFAEQKQNTLVGT